MKYYLLFLLLLSNKNQFGMEQTNSKDNIVTRAKTEHDEHPAVQLYANKIHKPIENMHETQNAMQNCLCTTAAAIANGLVLYGAYCLSCYIIELPKQCSDQQ